MATENLIPLPPMEPEELEPGSGLQPGVVRARVDGGLLVSHERGSTWAKRAASCLLAPKVGDSVLLAVLPAGAFVLAVLEREGGDRELVVEGELRLVAARVSVEAEDELTLRSRGASRLLGETLTLAAKEATWVGQQLRVLGEQLTLDATRIKQVSSYAEVVAESASERLGRSYRDIRESEHVKAGALTFSLRRTLRFHADTAVLTAKRLVKLGADQIHLG